MTTSTKNTAEAAAVAKQYAARSAELLHAVAVWSGQVMPENKHKLGVKALRKVGFRMLAKRDALPQEPSQLRQYVETVKQRAQKVLAGLDAEGQLGTVATHAAISSKLLEAIENCESFIAIYSATRDFEKAQNAA